MAAPLVPILIVLVLLGALAFYGLRMANQRREKADELLEDKLPYLRYHVPDHQDIAAVVAALRQDGFDAVSEVEGPHYDVLIPCPAGTDRDRAKARAAIGHATNPEGDPLGLEPVRFEDE